MGRCPGGGCAPRRRGTASRRRGPVAGGSRAASRAAAAAGKTWWGGESGGQRGGEVRGVERAWRGDRAEVDAIGERREVGEDPGGSLPATAEKTRVHRWSRNRWRQVAARASAAAGLWAPSSTIGASDRSGSACRRMQWPRMISKRPGQSTDGQSVVDDVVGERDTGGVEGLEGERGILGLVGAGQGDRVADQRLLDELERAARPRWPARAAPGGRRGAGRTRRTGIPSTKMPAFSKAICSMVSPSHCWWSRAIGVITQTSAGTAVVASSRPPMPVSSTISSHSRSRKWRIASASVISKKVGCGSSDSQRARSSVRPSAGFLLGDLGAGDPDALAEVDQVRRGEQPAAEPGGAGDRVDHRADRALAVGAGDMDHAGVVRREGEEFPAAAAAARRARA